MTTILAAAGHTVRFRSVCDGGCGHHVKGCISAQGTIGRTETGTVAPTCFEADHVISKALDYTIGNLYTQETEAFFQAILDQKIIGVLYESQKSGRRIYLILRF